MKFIRVLVPSRLFDKSYAGALKSYVSALNGNVLLPQARFSTARRLILSYPSGKSLLFVQPVHSRQLLKHRTLTSNCSLKLSNNEYSYRSLRGITFNFQKLSTITRLIPFSSPYCTTTSTASETTKPLLNLCPHEFAEFLKSKKLNRCFLIWSDSAQRVVASHDELKEIEDWLNDPSNPNYRQHEAIFLSTGIRTSNLLGAFLWRINRGQACGGIRMKPYSTLESYLTDGLRLSRRLGIKSALAGLWVGGGKGIIPEPKNRQHIHPDFRSNLFYDYGDFVSSLNGCYIAGMDNVNTHDLYNVHSRTRWVICGPEDIGGAGNAAGLLGQGVICAMEAALDHLRIKGGFAGLKVAVQGAGGIGLDVVSRLLDKDVSHVYVSDASQKRVGDLHDVLIPKAKGRLTVEKVAIDNLDIIGHDCDILAPCAVGHVLTPETIPNIKARIVCGTANAILSSEEHAKIMVEHNITYVLEYLPNRMALVNSVYENYGRLYRDPLIWKHFSRDWEHSIYVLTKKALQTSVEKGITVVEAVTQLAEVYNEQMHPLWPGRTKAIIQDLIARQWHNGRDFWQKRRNFGKAEGCA